MPVKYMNCEDWESLDDFGVSNFKAGGGGGGRKNKKGKGKDKNPDGKYTSKHVRVSQSKKELSQAKRPKEKKEAKEK